MIIAEKTSIRVSIKELLPMKVAAYRIISSTPESDAATYLDLYYPVCISDFAN